MRTMQWQKESVRLSLVFICLLAATSLVRAQAPVNIWQAPLVLPTYQIGPPDREPMFYAGREYQGAQGAIYPYGLYDNLLDVRENQTYQADFLENKYVKICVLPELGGRILSATDKTNGYDYVYRQTEIRPALIGMLGAWISGGVEWNIPHHHRATSYLPDLVVIASHGGDPFVLDLSRSDGRDAPILTAEHGTGEWNFEKAADSFLAFLEELAIRL